MHAPGVASNDLDAENQPPTTLPVWLQWLMVVGGYGILWLPIAAGWSLDALETGEHSAYPVVLPPVVFVVVPIAVGILSRGDTRRVLPGRYLAATVLVSVVLLVLLRIVTAFPPGAGYFGGHPGREFWSWIAALAVAPLTAVAGATRSRVPDRNPAVDERAEILSATPATGDATRPRPPVT